MNHLTNPEVKPDFVFGNSGPIQPTDPIVYCICESMNVNKIFHVGMYPSFPETLGPEYDLLVLIDSESKKPIHEFESLIANRCHDFAMVTASVHKTEVIRQLLKQGNIFFSALCKKENLIFNDGSDDLDFDTSRVTICSQECEREFALMHSKAKSFLSGAKNFMLSGDNQLAAFMLHQTIEQCLNAMLTPLIGYRLQTHNLSRLFIYARRLSPKVCAVFPRNTDGEIRLYQILQKAYIYGRYKNNFQIGKEELQVLTGRASELLTIAYEIFYEKLQVLHQGNKIISQL